jgi:hypothetical protein
VISERQLKRKINDWKLGKNVKSHEMIFIARKTQQRAAIGKNTIFRVRGKSVEPSKIERWEKRCGDVFLNDTPASIAISCKLDYCSFLNPTNLVLVAVPSTPSGTYLRAQTFYFGAFSISPQSQQTVFEAIEYLGSSKPLISSKRKNRLLWP